MGGHEGTIQIKYDDLSMKPKIISTRFNVTFGILMFDEKSFFSILIGFKPFWDYRPTKAIHADSSGYLTSENIMN